jgi:hypothetical protein
MDAGFSYGTSNGLHASIYCPPEYEAPDEITLTIDGEPVVLVRLSDRSLECRDVAGVAGHCVSHDCHRRVLGECQCGRHGRDIDGNKVRVPFSRAVSDGKAAQ